MYINNKANDIILQLHYCEAHHGQGTDDGNHEIFKDETRRL